MTDLSAQIEALIKEAEAGNIVNKAREILGLLQQHNVAVTMRLSPSVVGVHPLNRDGLGVNAHDVHQLLSDIVDVGWSESQVSGVCVDATGAVKQYNADLMKSTDGMLPVFACNDSIKYASLAASHTNQALRCIIGQARHQDERLTIHGLLNLEKVRLKDPAMAKACEVGILWLVLPSTLLDRHQGLAALIQSSYNCAGQIARAESEVQVLRRLHSCWHGASLAGPVGQHVDFALIKQKVLRSKPPCANAIAFMYSFMLKTCGGTSASILLETEQFLKDMMATTKSVGAEMFDVLSTDMKNSGSQCIYLRHGLLKLAYCSSVSTSETKRFLAKDNLDKCLEAESIMVDMRGVCAKFLDRRDVRMAIGQLDIDLAAKVIGKRNSSFALIAHKFIQELNKLTGSVIASRFEAACLQELQDEKQRAAVPSTTLHSKGPV